jgi:hypothetical protein
MSGLGLTESEMFQVVEGGGEVLGDVSEAWPLPGTATFHAMFSVADHWVGIPFSRLIPSPKGPRQPGQFSAINEIDTTNNNATNLMRGLSGMRRAGARGKFVAR